MSQKPWRALPAVADIYNADPVVGDVAPPGLTALRAARHRKSTGIRLTFDAMVDAAALAHVIEIRLTDDLVPLSTPGYRI